MAKDTRDKEGELMPSIYVRQPNGRYARYSECTKTFTDINMDVQLAKSLSVIEKIPQDSWGDEKAFSQLAGHVLLTHGEKMHAKVMELANEQTTWTAKLVEVDDVSSVCQPPS